MPMACPDNVFRYDTPKGTQITENYAGFDAVDLETRLRYHAELDQWCNEGNPGHQS